MYEGLVLHSLERVVSVLRWALLVGFCAVVLSLLVACERQIAPPLVEVTELAPRELEVGDRLEVHGSGFPQGRSAQVTFDGTVHRPGEPPLRGVRIDVEGVTTSSDRVEILLRDHFVERLAGRGDTALHATFRGEVRVAFASSAPGAPPLVGKLHGAVFDVLPSSVRANLQDARMSEGGRVLAYLGVVAGPPSARGLPIEQVQQGSLGERIGAQVGDVLVAVDGVSALSISDVIPASARSAELTIRHAGSGAEETKTVSLREYASERVPTEFVPALIVVGIAVVLLVILLLPGPQALAAFELRVAAYLRETSLRASWIDLVGRGRVAALSVLVSALVSAFALAPYVVARELDGVMLLVLASSLLLWSRASAGRGVLAKLGTIARLLPAALAMIVAIVLAAFQVGAIELTEISRIQGGMPWEFTAARQPSCALLLAVYAVAIISILRIRSSSPRAILFERAGVLAASALGATTFLGGWQLPGVVEPQTRMVLLLAAATFVLKTWVFAGTLLAGSRLAVTHEAKDVVVLVLKRLVPALALAGAFVAVSRRVMPSVAVETAYAGILVALAALFCVRLATRVRAATSRPVPHASPFL
jgi:NADH-quinone oxidoreductase subunit H